MLPAVLGGAVDVASAFKTIARSLGSMLDASPMQLLVCTALTSLISGCGNNSIRC